VNTKSIEALKDDKASTPNQARCYLDALRGLFRWAKDAKHVTRDPTRDIDNPERQTGDGFPPWSDAEVALYDARWPLGTKERVWKDLLLYIGCRRGDAVLLGRQHVKDGVITFVTEKGRSKRRIEVSRRIDPELATSLQAGPTGDLIFICGERGDALTKETFGNMFREACDAAGIKGKSAHGLRKRAATIWAERGATEMELMAMFGWLTPSMAALYTRTANRKRMALAAEDRHRTQIEHSIPAPGQKVRG
jgi:integrase